MNAVSVGVSGVLFALVLSCAGCASAQERESDKRDLSQAVSAPKQNTLTAEDREAGWRLLFDGTSSDAWRGYRREEFPDKGWRVVNGMLEHTAGGGGGDIITKDAFGDFEFRTEWRVAEGGNSGIMYLVDESGNASWQSGPEMQVLDDAKHADGKNPLTSAGALYGLIPAPRGIVKPAGEWNHARIRFKDGVVEHWLNGERIVRIDLDGEEFAELVANSKFASMPRFGKNRRGHIVLQDHGDLVQYRNIAVREL